MFAYLVIFLVFCLALWLAERPVCECRHPFDAKRDLRQRAESAEAAERISREPAQGE